MKAIVQRVRGFCEILCEHERQTIHRDSFSGPGLVVLLGWDETDLNIEDTSREDWLLSRIVGLRVFPDANEKMNLSLQNYLAENSISLGGILWVPNFTLSANLDSGFRPSFSKALKPDLAQQRYSNLQKKVAAMPGASIKNLFGVFQSEMQMTFSTWGPITIPFEV
jgi:D-tyrosyl-tRNA(Tyr) deacylase